MSYAPVPPPLPQQVSHVPPAPLAYASPGVQVLMPITGRARAAIACFWVLLALNVLASLAGIAFLVAFREQISDDSAAATADPFAGAILPAVIALAGLGLVFMAAWVVTVVMYCMWQYRAHANASAMTGGLPRFRPGWGVGYWFIPILQLFRPYQVVRSIDEMTPQAASLPLGDAITAWWALLISSTIIGIVSDRIIDVSDAMYTLSLGLDVLTTVMDVVAIVLVIRIIRSISARQAAIVG